MDPQTPNQQSPSQQPQPFHPEPFNEKPQSSKVKRWVIGGISLLMLVGATLFFMTQTKPPIISLTTQKTGDKARLVATSSPTAALGLDPSGKTIPDTNYAIPSGAIYMSPSGSDAKSGSSSAPVKTLGKAVALVPSGGTIVARGGVYRDGIAASQQKKFTLQAYPHEQVWFDGTNVVTNWQAAGSQWSVSWNTPAFCGGKYYERSYLSQRSDNTGPCTHVDMAKDPSYLAAGDPQMVFIDGVAVPEVTTKAKAVGNKFFYDQSAKKLYLGTNPKGHTVELTARPVAFKLEAGSGGNVIRGIGFRKYASNEFTGNATQAAIYAGVPNITVEKSVFTQNAGAGIAFGKSSNTVVRSTVFAKNGFNGLDANGTHIGKGTDNFTIEKSVFDGNNTEHFGTGCSKSCAQAGSKMAHMVGFTLKNNVFQNNIGHGYWCDLACDDGKIVNNVFRNNTKAGIYYEVSQDGIIASNLVYGNKEYGIKNGSGTTKIYNNTVVNSGTSALIYDDSRAASGSEISADTRKVEMANNIFSGASSTMLQNWKGQTNASQLYSLLDYNSYYRAGGTPKTLVEWRAASTSTYASLASFRSATGYEKNGQDVTSGSDPFFTDVAREDYRVRASSTTKHSGKALPADVAKLLGLPAGTVPDRGALNWPGRP